MTTLKQGSKGNDVLTLQKALNSKGYSLSEDGIFGAKTLAAVKDYQTKNGLAIDGIVGTNTWGSLNSSSASSGSSSSSSSNVSGVSAATQQGLSNYSSGFKQSDTATSLQNTANATLANIQSLLANGYDKTYATNMQDLLNQIQNMGDFSYNLDTDALYQQYKQKYTQQGQKAMMDTMGQAAALTGGYGSSYATTAGNQAYQSYLQNLNDIVPALEEQAYTKYQNKKSDLYNQYSVAAQADERVYGQYQDAIANQYNLYSSQYGQYGDTYNKEYQQYSDLGAYNMNQASLENSDYWNQKNYNYQVQQDAISNALAAAKTSSSSSSSSSAVKTSASALNTITTNITKIVKDIPTYSVSKVEATNKKLSDYLNTLVDSGTISQDTALNLYGQYQVIYKGLKGH